MVLILFSGLRKNLLTWTDGPERLLKCHQEDHQTQKSRRYNKFGDISGEILYNEAVKSVANTQNNHIS